MEVTGGRSAAVGYLGPPEVDFSESHQIAYLASEMPVFASKKFFDPMVGRSMTLARHRPPRADFSECSQIVHLGPVPETFTAVNFSI